MIAIETTLHKRQNDKQINIYRSAYEQRAYCIVIAIKGHEMTNVKQFKREK